MVRDFYAHSVFPRFYDTVLTHQGFEQARKENLRRVRGRILEVGIGTGLNLDFYPSWVREIDAIEPNYGMRSQLAKKMNRCPIHVRCCPAVAERLPFEDGSFDTVVSTFTLCSFKSIPKALNEVKRVLSPHGRFIFMEHGLAESRWTAKLQNLLNPIQSWIGCGCRLTVQVERELEGAGLVCERLEKSFVGRGPRVLAFVYRGVAAVRPKTCSSMRAGKGV